MKHPFLSIATSAALSLLCGPPIAFAQGTPRTIQITVPVKLSNFGGTEAWVWCELRDTSGRPVAVNYKAIPVRNGSADQPVKVGVSIQPLQEALIPGWRCVLTAPDPVIRVGGGGAGKPHTAIPNLHVFGEITGKF